MGDSGSGTAGDGRWGETDLTRDIVTFKEASKRLARGDVRGEERRLLSERKRDNLPKNALSGTHRQRTENRPKKGTQSPISDSFMCATPG